MEMGLSHLPLAHKQTYVALITKSAFCEPVARGNSHGLCSLSWIRIVVELVMRASPAGTRCQAAQPCTALPARPTSSCHLQEGDHKRPQGEVRRLLQLAVKFLDRHC